MPPLKIGLIINPLAGIGGPVAPKGSDGDKIVQAAIARGSQPKAQERTLACLTEITAESICWAAMSGEMGEDACRKAGLKPVILGTVTRGKTTAADTRAGVEQMQIWGADLLLFTGGDGTAADVYDALTQPLPVLGIPGGVKMHSGVFANNPQAAAKLINKLLRGELLSLISAEVRDIDESGFREGRVRTRYHGDMSVPDDIQFMQQTKLGGREVEAITIQDIAAFVVENMQLETVYFAGSGSTVAGVMDKLRLPNTLLGVDVIKDNQLLLPDATEAQLFDYASRYPAEIIITPIGGQGHIFGRGNQQFSPRVIRATTATQVVATKTKLLTLNGRPLRVDTGDATLDATLCGTAKIITGYDDAVLYRISD